MTPISSCTIARDHSILFAKPEPSGKTQKAALKVIKLALTKANNRMTVEAAISELIASPLLIATPQNKRSNRARKLLEDLTTGGHLSSRLVDDEGWIWRG